MEIFVSLSAIEYSGDDMAEIDSACTPVDLKHLASAVFGVSRFSQEELGQLSTRRGILRASPSGTQGAVWLLDDKRLTKTSDFQSIMKPMPMIGMNGTGSYYMTLIVPHREPQFLVYMPNTKSLLWFGSAKVMTDYFAERDAQPSVKLMLTGNRGNASIIRSWSAVEPENDFV